MNDILQLRNDYFLKSYVQQEVEMTYIVIDVGLVVCIEHWLGSSN